MVIRSKRILRTLLAAGLRKPDLPVATPNQTNECDSLDFNFSRAPPVSTVPRKLGLAPRNPHAHQAGRKSCGHRPAANRCHAPPDADKDGTLARRNADGRPARGPVGQRASGKERGKSASGSAQKCRALRIAKHGTERVRHNSRSTFPLPIVTRMGRDYRPGLRKQIERVARRAAKIPSCLNLTLLSYLTT